MSKKTLRQQTVDRMAREYRAKAQAAGIAEVDEETWSRIAQEQARQQYGPIDPALAAQIYLED